MNQFNPFGFLSRLSERIKQNIRTWILNIHTGNASWDQFLISLLQYDERSREFLRLSLLGNLLYAFFKLITGIVYHSVWLVGLSGYYAILGCTRFMLLRSLGRGKAYGQKAYRTTAFLLLLLTLVMGFLLMLTMIKAETFVYPGVLIYAFALYAFVKTIVAIHVLLDRKKQQNDVLAAAHTVSFACACMSILALQTALIYTFGDPAFGKMMNTIFGAIMIVIMLVLSGTMLFRSTRLKEEN